MYLNLWEFLIHKHSNDFVLVEIYVYFAKSLLKIWSCVYVCIFEIDYSIWQKGYVFCTAKNVDGGVRPGFS